ncbi:hypothetical protein MHLP_04240 [Candidatus Mycoplasma haematolamae str. Purdue]|uniref:Uncharacterized protein n=1 Tax=Mycoplasma haematolamae (strain Purdue) TaxID=1212765 RepID=I7BKK7_MYCHA|nr:hypothetical protein [Candidatus Mycoplasma haematolamae]AFO52428.1 hypothetical protein MHLP_04240 [Candidatus Mycoplasma haematolamae str. Purdue]
MTKRTVIWLASGGTSLGTTAIATPLAVVYSQQNEKPVGQLSSDSSPSSQESVGSVKNLDPQKTKEYETLRSDITRYQVQPSCGLYTSSLAIRLSSTCR